MLERELARAQQRAAVDRALNRVPLPAAEGNPRHASNDRIRRDLDDLDRELESFAGEVQPTDDVCHLCDRLMYGRGAGACRCRCDDCGRRRWRDCTCQAESFAAPPARRRAANPAKESAGHIAWLDDGTKEAFLQGAEVYIAPANTPLDIDGFRQGARWECSKKAWDRYFDALFKPRIEANPSRRDRDFAHRQTALPGLAETGFSLTPQQDALARRRGLAREEREAARREAEFKAGQATMFGDDRGGE